MEPNSPPSGGLFFSSSPTQTSPGPVEEVQVIVTQARQNDRMNKVLEDIIYNNSDAFFEAFVRRVELIKSRSQAFQDCHITVFDKALLELTQNGNDLRDASAILFFCEAHLGISINAETAQMKLMLSNALLLPKAFSQVSPPLSGRRASASTNKNLNRSPVKRRLIKSSSEEQKPAILASLAAKIDAPTLRLWSVYEQAKDEFFSIEDPNSIDKQESAKFLRDTSENTLHHLMDKNPDQRLVDELQATLSIAKHTAMTLHGGKKRKFDEPIPSTKRTRLLGAQHPRSDNSKVTQEDERHEWPPRTANERQQNELFSGNDRTVTYRARSEDKNFTRERYRFIAPELSPKPIRAPKQKRRQPGRGHSGIPYGYNRPVDSYYPPSDI